jgi:hypothetical protein
MNEHAALPLSESAKDPVVDEVREVRRQISARFEHDPARLVAHYMELQQQYKERLLSPNSSPDSEESAA